MVSERLGYIVRRISGIVLYGLAYAALWPGLTYPVMTIQGNATFWSNSKLDIGTGDRFLEPISRSTIDLIVDLFESRYYFPCGVIALFSVVSPAIKLLVIMYGEIVGNIFRVRMDAMSRIVDLRKGLRVIAKYQCVDVFVGIITRELVNSDFVTCRLEAGFYYFGFYSLLSILAAQLSDAIPPRPRAAAVPVESVLSGRILPLDLFLLFSSVSMFAFGLGWSLGFPILSVKFLFQSKIVIGESVASLANFFSHADDNVSFPSFLVLVTCVVVPCLVVLLSSIVQVFDPSRSSRFLARFTSFLADWSLIDVFAVALLTCLFSFASFSLLRANAPWGFYALLMAAMSAFEVSKAVLVSLLDAPGEGYVKIVEQEMNEFSLNSSDEEELPSSKDSKTLVVTQGGFVYVAVTLVKKLGLPFFFLKALGWVVFFTVWFMNSGSGSVDVNSLSATLRANIPFVTDALKAAVPGGVGMCRDMNSKLIKCIEKPYLYYTKNAAFEVLARWLRGFDQITVVDMYVSVPAENKLALTVKGEFAQIDLSLFIGQCLGNFFSPSDDGDESNIPKCSKVFDQIHSWKNIGWSVEVAADCSRADPFVQNIFIDEVLLDSEMTIQEEIAFGISVPVDDLSAHFKQGIRDSIQPLLVSKEGWIPWGPQHLDLATLLSKLVKLNIDTTSQFSCPSPT